MELDEMSLNLVYSTTNSESNLFLAVSTNEGMLKIVS
jgi:hypothetical protein